MRVVRVSPAVEVQGGMYGVGGVAGVVREEAGGLDDLPLGFGTFRGAGTRGAPEAPLRGELLAQLGDAPGEKARRGGRDAVLAQPPALHHQGDEGVTVPRKSETVAVLPVKEVVGRVLRF